MSQQSPPLKDADGVHVDDDPESQQQQSGPCCEMSLPRVSIRVILIFFFMLIFIIPVVVIASSLLVRATDAVNHNVELLTTELGAKIIVDLERAMRHGHTAIESITNVSAQHAAASPIDDPATRRQFFNQLTMATFAFEDAYDGFYNRFVDGSYAFVYRLSPQVNALQLCRSHAGIENGSAAPFDVPYDCTQLTIDYGASGHDDIVIPSTDTGLLARRVFYNGTLTTLASSWIGSFPQSQSILFPQPFFLRFKNAGGASTFGAIELAALYITERRDAARPWLRTQGWTGILVSTFSRLLRDALPVDGARAYVSDASNYIMSSSHDRTFTVQTLAGAGGVFPGCFLDSTGTMVSCLFNLSTYPPYRLLRAAGVRQDETSKQLQIPFAGIVLDRQAEGFPASFFALRERLLFRFPMNDYVLHLFVPREIWLSSVDESGALAIVLCVLFVLAGGGCTYLLLKTVAGSIEELAEKMQDPWNTTKRLRESSDSSSSSTSGTSGDGPDHTSSNNNDDKRQESDKASSKATSKASRASLLSASSARVHFSAIASCFGADACFFELAEIAELETAFVDFRAIIDKLSTYMLLGRGAAAAAHATPSPTTSQDLVVGGSGSASSSGSSVAVSPSVSPSSLLDASGDTIARTAAAFESASGSGGTMDGSGAAAAADDGSVSPSKKEKKKKSVRFAEEASRTVEYQMDTIDVLRASTHNYVRRRVVRPKHKHGMQRVLVVFASLVDSRCADEIRNRELASAAAMSSLSPSPSPSSALASPFSPPPPSTADAVARFADRTELFVKEMNRVSLESAGTILDVLADYFVLTVTLRNKMPSNLGRRVVEQLGDVANKIAAHDVKTTTTATAAGVETREQQHDRHHHRHHHHDADQQHRHHSPRHQRRHVTITAGVACGVSRIVEMQGDTGGIARPLSFVANCVPEAAAVEREMRLRLSVSTTGSNRVGALPLPPPLFPSSRRITQSHAIGYCFATTQQWLQLPQRVLGRIADLAVVVDGAPAMSPVLSLFLDCGEDQSLPRSRSHDVGALATSSPLLNSAPRNTSAAAMSVTAQCDDDHDGDDHDADDDE